MSHTLHIMRHGINRINYFKRINRQHIINRNNMLNRQILQDIRSCRWRELKLLSIIDSYAQLNEYVHDIFMNPLYISDPKKYMRAWTLQKNTSSEQMDNNLDYYVYRIINRNIQCMSI